MKSDLPGDETSPETDDEMSRDEDTEVDPVPMMDHRWAEEVLVEAEQKVSEYYSKAGKSELYDCLKPYLIMDPKKIDYETVAPGLGLSLSEFRSALFRMRNRFFIFAMELVEDSGNQKH